MRAADYVNVFIFITILMIASPILGRYIAKVFDSEKKGKWESFIYRILFIDTTEQTAKSYLKNLLQFNLIGFITFFVIVYLFPSAKQKPETTEKIKKRFEGLHEAIIENPLKCYPILRSMFPRKIKLIPKYDSELMETNYWIEGGMLFNAALEKSFIINVQNKDDGDAKGHPHFWTQVSLTWPA